MQFCRLYTGQDGKSHFEDLDQSQTSQHFLGEFAATAVVFKNDPLRSDLHAFHNAPRRQWCITLSGGVEIGLGDGSKRTFGPGDVFLAEDVSGQGHTAKPSTWVRAFVHV